MGEINIENGHKIFLADAHWADIVQAHRVKGVKGLAIRFWFFAAAFPYLFAGAIGPRFGASAGKLKTSNRSFWSRLLQGARLRKADFVQDASIAWRGLSVYAGIVALTASYWFSWWLGATLSVALIVVVLLFLAWPTTIAEHIRMAAAQSVELEKIRGRVSGTISLVEKRCKRVWVIAHSQGGYIVHSLLTDRPPNTHPRVTRFTAIASGLRPIHLAALPTNSRLLIGGWVHLVGVAVVTLGMLLAFEPGGFLSVFHGQTVMNALAQVVAFPLLALSAQLIPQPLTEIWGAVYDHGLNGLGYLLLGILIIAVGFLVRSGTSEHHWFIKDLPPRVRWEEASSGSDLVGSMSVPSLPDRVDQFIVPTLRNTFLDHGLKSYFSKFGSLRFHAAALLVKSSVGKSQAQGICRTARLVTASFENLSRQVYTLRASVLFAALFFSIGIPVIFGRSILTLSPTAVIVGTISSIFGWCLAYFRWKRLTPRIIDHAQSGLVTPDRKILKAIRPPLRTSVGIIQGALLIFTVIVSIGLEQASNDLEVLHPPSLISEHLGVAATRLMTMGLMLAVAAICLVTRMGGSNIWNAVALFYGALALLEIIAAISSTPSPTIMTSGIIPLFIILVFTVVQLCRCPWRPMYKD